MMMCGVLSFVSFQEQKPTTNNKLGLTIQHVIIVVAVVAFAAIAVVSTSTTNATAGWTRMVCFNVMLYSTVRDAMIATGARLHWFLVV
jgi:hypothetical protein